MPTYNDSKDMRLRAILLQFVVPGVLVLASTRADAFCYREAGNKYGIDPDMLESIALTESSFRPNIESHTADIGLMGINRSWLPVLHKKFGLSEADVWNPCTNVHIGAWILANSYRQHGKSWEAVGAYNAACTKLKGRACYRARMTYANKVYQNWKRLKTRSS